MFTPRRSLRVRAALTATLEIRDPSGTSGTVAGRTLDLSRDGVGVLVPSALAAGQRLTITIEDTQPGRHRRVRRWMGHVVHTAGGPAGAHRLGIAFEAPDRGPVATFWITTTGAERLRVLRLDPAWSATSDTDADGEGAEAEASPGEGAEPAAPDRSRESEPMAGDPSEGRESLLRLIQTITVLGLLMDQVSKHWMFDPRARGLVAPGTLVPGLLDTHPTVNPGLVGGLAAGGPWFNALVAVVSLVVLGILARGVRERGPASGRLEAAGWGCLLAGVFGNASDRLLLGFVRDLFTTSLLPGWTFNLADILVVLGVVAIASGWLGLKTPVASAEGPQSSALSRISRNSTRPGRP